MAVRFTMNGTGQAFTGKHAVVEDGKVSLFSGIMSDKKGGFRSCGKKQVFDVSTITVEADNPAKELKTRSQ